ncbi:MAG: zf-HC2 domain-containing protein [Thermodesulfobacteriota bacterium]
MECERIKDRFSSLWEKELTSLEEKDIREHLSSCPECRREFEQFQKTMQWLHSVEEVEVPDGFLPELHKKIEDRRTKAAPGKTSTRRWFNLPISVKLPVQAVAMVAIVFLVLYLSKMMPTGIYHLKESKQTSSIPSSEQKTEKMLAHKEADEERKVLKRPAEAQRLKDLGQVETSVPAKAMGTPAPQVKAEAKKEEAPSPKNEITDHEAFDLREREKAKSPSAEPEGNEKGFAGKEKSAGTFEKSVVTLKPPQEIVLRISDRGKVVSQLQELIKQFGGEVVTMEGNIVVAFLPTSSFSEFEKEVAELSSSPKEDKLNQEKQATGSLRAAPEAKRKEAPKRAADAEGRTIVRIQLIQE